MTMRRRTFIGGMLGTAASAGVAAAVREHAGMSGPVTTPAVASGPVTRSVPVALVADDAAWAAWCDRFVDETIAALRLPLAVP